MRTPLAPRAGLLSLATAAALTLAPAVPAAQAQAAPKPPTAATVTTPPGHGAAVGGTSCGRWAKSPDGRLGTRACWRKKNKQTQPQGAFHNRTNKKIIVAWVVRYKTIRYGPWRVCKQGKGPLKPRQQWVTWCGWYKKVADVRVTGTVSR